MVNPVKRARISAALAVGGTAALALLLATVAHAQQRQLQAPPDTPTMTDVQAAGVKRVKEMIEALNSGDYATMRA
ncbi:MAG TPA: hypothetical protein VE379_02760, partial [Vicinamibacterales bacterium]|nr:hypothetical protein [Vicinamibacterales bacterium]